MCVGDCIETPSCVKSSVNVDRGQRQRLPVYSVIHTITVTMTPNTGTDSAYLQTIGKQLYSITYIVEKSLNFSSARLIKIPMSITENFPTL